MSVAIVDYDMGNLLNVKRACAHAGLDAEITSDPKAIAEAKLAILPGVGAFGDAMAKLAERGLADALRERAAKDRPLVGICLGLQLLFESSEEHGSHEGLGILRGKVVRFTGPMKVPHMSWEPLAEADVPWSETPLASTKPGESMYFVHSYYVVPADEGVVLARARYGGLDFCAAARKGATVAFQFHPERSGPAGLRIYDALAKVARS